MNNALIGFTGFVGSTLFRKSSFEGLYRSTNIQDIEGKSFDTVFCAGVSAQKWLANRDPHDDLEKISSLIRHLRSVKCKKFVLISTIDVFKNPVGVDEDTEVDEVGLHAYGLNRRALEKFVENKFPEHLVVRLPGLVGPGLRKNIIFDFLNNNNLMSIESRGVFQFYPMDNLWQDVEKSLRANLSLMHLTAAPISVADVALKGFGIQFEQELGGTPARYDMQTRHAEKFGKSGRYLYGVDETIESIRAYAKSEPLKSV